MLIYWLLMVIPAALAVAGLRKQGTSREQRASRSQSNSAIMGSFLMVVFWLFYNLVAGFRYQSPPIWYRNPATRL